jgi:hypothetical protein
VDNIFGEHFYYLVKILGKVGQNILYNVYIKILKPVFHFVLTYPSISFCVEVISSTLVLRKQRNSGNWLIIKSSFVPIIVLMPPSKMSISQNDRTIC